MKLLRSFRYFQILNIIIVLLFAGGLAFSQSAPPPPAPPQAPTGIQNPKDATILRAVVRLIQVTVVAEDGDGKPVTDLKKEDFLLRDNGQAQKLTFFAEQNSVAAQLSTVGTRPTAVANFFSNHVENSPSGANSVTILLFDALNTDFRDLSYAREKVINFLQHMQPQDQVALYVLTPSTLYVMHDFTNDSGTLVRLMGGKAEKTSTTSTAAPGPDDAKIEKLISDSLGESNAFYKAGQRVNRVETTSQAMLQIAQNVVNIPGRKNLIWISAGFPVTMGTAIPLGSRDNGYDFTGMLSSTAMQLGDANVAVYPVDARGLVGPRGGRAGVSPNMDAMVRIADGTGGRPLYNTNDIATSIRKAVDDSRVSYLLGYYPTNDKWDGRFRELSIKLARPGVHLRYKTGYYAVPANPENDKRNELLTADAIRSPLQMIDLGLEVHADAVSSTAAERELKVNVRVDPFAMRFMKDGDRWTDGIEVVWVGLTPDGRILSRDKDSIDLHPEQSGYEEIQHAGLSFSEHIHVGNDSTELRLIVRDRNTGSIGSVNIPLGVVFAGSTAQTSSR
ncbi:MAG TPA: VWA domain-containing protein [Candidatus Acidoferrales bacterium]|jgi:VWFA-related protein